jgi:hypothetical protein
MTRRLGILPRTLVTVADLRWITGRPTGQPCGAAVVIQRSPHPGDAGNSGGSAGQSSAPLRRGVCACGADEILLDAEVPGWRAAHQAVSR